MKIPRLRARLSHLLPRFQPRQQTKSQRDTARRRRRWLRRNTINLVFAIGLIAALLLTLYIMQSMGAKDITSKTALP